VALVPRVLMEISASLANPKSARAQGGVPMTVQGDEGRSWLVPLTGLFPFSGASHGLLVHTTRERRL
jgi:hypothetical protein